MDKDLLQSYADENKSINDIAILENKSKTAVKYWLNKYNIKTTGKPGVKTIQSNNKCTICESNTINSKMYCSDKCKSKAFYINNINKIKAKQKNATEVLRKTKKELVEYKGNKCSLCNYNKNFAALVFHHADPSEKEFRVSGKLLRKNIVDLKLEADKCELLCENCHQEVHWKENQKIINPSKPPLKSREVRKKLIDYKGGKCAVCSYNKCDSSLAFHHLDESLKEFNIDARVCNGYSYDRLIKEADKCLLLCHNCHMELHHPELKM